MLDKDLSNAYKKRAAALPSGTAEKRRAATLVKKQKMTKQGAGYDLKTALEPTTSGYETDNECGAQTTKGPGDWLHVHKAVGNSLQWSAANIPVLVHWNEKHGAVSPRLKRRGSVQYKPLKLQHQHEWRL